MFKQHSIYRNTKRIKYKEQQKYEVNITFNKVKNTVGLVH